MGAAGAVSREETDRELEGVAQIRGERGVKS